jgi:hypothetical protein
VPSWFGIPERSRRQLLHLLRHAYPVVLSIPVCIPLIEGYTRYTKGQLETLELDFLMIFQWFCGHCGYADTQPRGGRGGIRTHEGGYPLPVFKTGALNHSATLPYQQHQPLSRLPIRASRERLNQNDPITTQCVLLPSLPSHPEIVNTLITEMQKKVGRPPGKTQDRPFQMKVNDALMASVDDWRRKQPDLSSRAEAISAHGGACCE